MQNGQLNAQPQLHEQKPVDLLKSLLESTDGILVLRGKVLQLSPTVRTDLWNEMEKKSLTRNPQEGSRIASIVQMLTEAREKDEQRAASSPAASTLD